MTASIFWHRNDLRIEQNDALLAACEDAFVQPIVFREPPTLSGAAAVFRDQALADLRARYEARGNRLLILEGDPVEVIPRLVTEGACHRVVFSRAHDAINQAVERACARALAPLQCRMDGVWTDVLVAHLDFPPGVLPDDADFSAFQKHYGPLISFDPRAPQLPAILPPPPGALGHWADGHESLTHDTGNDGAMVGGETAGHARIQTYFWERDTLAQYAQRREALDDMNATSRLSPYLAQGSVSPRHVFQELERFEKKRIANKSTRWLRAELLWRDYLRWLAHRASERLFSLPGMTGTERPWDTSPERLDRWARGLTGWPLIDAMMRELSATGFLSHQGRVNVSSFLVNDLGIDWRTGAQHFATTLIDHDTCSNYTNWQMVAGISPVALKHRRGIKQQSLRLDRSARYIKKWVPELRPLPPPTIHEMNGRDCGFDTRAFGVALGETYPAPLDRVKS
ncbi:MAG: DASH family cryptochrome [Myxococcota bacterium]|nr:DASH family cryptochrome [Myxococcota bacterium]